MAAKNSLKVLVTGSTGLVGSRFVELVKGNFSIITIGRDNVDFKINLTSSSDVKRFVETSDAKAVVNFAAYTNVDEAEKEKGVKEGEVYTLNTMLPFWLAQACHASEKKLYHISTDYVFDGKQEDRPYIEEDIPKPVDSWYSITKYEGETALVKAFKNNKNYAIVRISYPFSGLYKRKPDIARIVVEKLSMRQVYLGITDQKIKPTSVDDIAQALSFILNRNLTGIFHIAGNYSPKEYITPYEFAQKIAKEMDMDISLIKPVSFIELSKKRLAQRPQHTWLSTEKIESIGFKLTSIDDALKRFKNQLLNLL